MALQENEDHGDKEEGENEDDEQSRGRGDMARPDVLACVWVKPG